MKVHNSAEASNLQTHRHTRPPQRTHPDKPRPPPYLTRDAVVQDAAEGEDVHGARLPHHATVPCDQLLGGLPPGAPACTRKARKVAGQVSCTPLQGGRAGVMHDPAQHST